MLNFVENLLENERGPMNDQDLTKTDYDPDRSLVHWSLAFLQTETAGKDYNRAVGEVFKCLRTERALS
jgi:hypothetical protein